MYFAVKDLESGPSAIAGGTSVEKQLTFPLSPAAHFPTQQN
jgi:hypothetical protein